MDGSAVASDELLSALKISTETPDDVLLSGELAEASGETASMHEDHDGATVRTVDLRCPHVNSQTVFTRHPDGRSAMEQKAVFVVTGQILPVGIEMRGILLWADTAICQRIANSRPRFGLLRPNRKHPETGDGELL